MVNGKQKGAGFEREVCKQLSLWVSNGTNVDLYWRSAMSGGRATVQKGKVRQAGDITAVAPEGHILTDHFYLELKHYKKLSIDCLIKGKGPLIDIWDTTLLEASKYNRIPALIYKQNNWPVMFVTTVTGIERLQIVDWLVLAASGMNFVRFDQLLKISFPLK